MTPDIVEKNEFIVVGVRSKWDLDPALPGMAWETSVKPRLTEITPASGSGNYSYAVFGRIPDDTEDRFEIVMGRLVENLENIPMGMVGWEIPAGVYGVLEVKGLESVYSAYCSFLTSWLPDSGYVHGDSPCFAVSSSLDAPADPNASWQVYISIRNTADLSNWAFAN